MKVLIVEEALKNLHGHWFQYINDIVNGGREAGYEIEVAVHRDACPEILKALPCRPILNATVFERERIPAGKLAGLIRVLTHNRSLYRDLSAFFAAGNTYDLVISTTTRLDHLPAYWWLYWRFKNRGFANLALIFIELVGEYTPDFSKLRFSTSTLLLKCALLACRPLLKRGQFFLVTESEGLARRYEAFCGIKFPLVPHVVSLPSLEPYRKAVDKDSDKLLLGTFGITRYDKGVDIFQDAIKLYQQQGLNNAGFVIQWINDYQLPDGSWARQDPVLLKDRNVQYLPRFSTPQEYYRWLACTDIMILPYRRDFYYDKLSRVAIDAALAGMPMVYPAGTWFESFVAQYAAGVAFQPESPESLAVAMQEIVARYAELKAQAEDRKQSVSEAFSAQVFFQNIMRLVK